MDIFEGKYKMIVMANPSRISRDSATQLLFIMRCKKQGVKVKFANGAEFADNELLVAIKKFIDDREADINENDIGK